MAQATHRKPACLPEQLLWIAPAVPPRARQRLRRGLVDRPVRAAFERACVEPGERQHPRRRRHMSGSPECEAQASASSSGPRPKRSAAPLSISGSACSAFTAERG